MAQSRIGPFSLDAPLSSQKRSGRVYRAIHLEQRKLAALRVFPVAMGMTPESRQAFADQLEELKQLRHPNVIRCYGGGFDTRNAFLAYELVEGETLRSILERRERLPWETALEYSQQLTEGLEYAHQLGWVHGRLKPDKVLVGSDGVVKISDWRREILESMIGGSATVGLMHFSAPEVLHGQAPDMKSDLYSVGVLMYAMLTGHPPFAAEKDRLPEVVQNTVAPKVSTTVLDCPVWLSAIVEQLLQKDPARRPFSAAALLLAFKEAEKRQSEGASVLQHAAAGFSPLQLGVDREEAERVLGIKPKKQKVKRNDTPFFEQAWVLLTALLLVVGTIVWFLLPLSQDTLRARAEQLLPPNTEEWMDWNRAREDYLYQLVRRFPDGTNLEWAQTQLAWVNAREHERRLTRENKSSRTSDWNDAERQYWMAKEYEEFGDLLSASEKYRALIGIYGSDDEVSSTVYLASEGLDRLKKKGRQSEIRDFVEQKLLEANKAYDAARILEARDKWDWIVTLYSGNQELAPQVKRAQQRLDELRERNN